MDLNALADFNLVATHGGFGRASRAIAAGDHVHLHNLVSDYTPTYALNGGA